MTGQGARAVIGQPAFYAQEFGSSSTRFGAIGGLAYAAGTLFATDANRLSLLPNNNRVLLFNNIKNQLPAANAEIPEFQGRCPVCGGVASTILGDKNADGTPAQGTTRTGMRLPVAVASDGKVLAVADTSNNRVLIWLSIPTVSGQPADVVLGQKDFVTVAPLAVTASGLRGPQGLWIQNDRLYVADTQNDRILIWNTIPRQNNQPADIVLGQPNFTTAPPINQVADLTAASNILLSPTSVTSDGTRLIVSDLGYSRVLIWNSLPTTNQRPADIVIGQPDFAETNANNSTKLCASNGTTDAGEALYPARCAKTLNFPRYALSDGQRLYIADGGNDRVLIYNSIPTTNGAAADVVLGQPDEFTSAYTSDDFLVTSASNVTPTPTSLAWDGDNLYVADATDYRILVFSPASPNVPQNGLINAASRDVFSAGAVTIGGTVRDKDVITVTINGTAYAYTLKTGDTANSIAQSLVSIINSANGGSGDVNVSAYYETNLATMRLVARQSGPVGNSITLVTSVSANATITATANNGTLFGGASAAQVAPGSLIYIRGQNLADKTETLDPNNPPSKFPTEIAGVQVYVDGIRIPLFAVSPGVIGGQLPFVVTGANSVSAWVRTRHQDGSVTVTNAIGVPVVPQNPGIFAQEGPEPRAAIALHASDFASGTIVVAGNVQGGDVANILVGGENYFYTVQTTDSLESIRDAFIRMINGNLASVATASAAGTGTKILLQAKVAGPAGADIPLSAKTVGISGAPEGAQLSLTASNSALCCFGVAGAPITEDFPAVPGERIILYATGFGLVKPDSVRRSIQDGVPFAGGENTPRSEVFAQVAAGGGTVLSSGLKQGQVGIYEVLMELPHGLVSNNRTPITFQQSTFTSNIVTIPVFKFGTALLTVTASTSTVTIPNTVTFTVKAFDSKNQPVTTYNSTLSISSSDPAAVLPPAVLIVNGTATFDVIFRTAGNQTVTAADAGTPTVQGTSSLIAVTSASQNYLLLTASTTSNTAGTPVTFTVSAFNSSNTVLSTFNGPISLSTTDPLANIPATVTLTNGTGTFSVTFRTAGTHTVTGISTTDTTMRGTSLTINVGYVNFAVLPASANATAGTPLAFTISTFDANGFAVTNYNSRLTLSSTDPAAVLPSVTVANGSASFSVTFNTPGIHNVTVINPDDPNVRGTSGAITVAPAQ